MVDPVNALMVFGFIVIGLTALFITQKKIVNNIRRTQNDKMKMHVEDALKHIYDCEYKNMGCTLHSIAGNLSISSDKAAKVIAKLESLKLIMNDPDKIKLTDEGRKYALQVIRIHRIWETYLADETSKDELEWHDDAELMEHTISSEEADRLAASIGNPLRDPHGDPIPSETGDIPELEGQQLNTLDEGDTARIVHLEDEPAAVYKNLVSQGLHVGMDITVNKRDKEEVLFESEGVSRSIPPVYAANVTVVKFEASIKPESYKKLSNLKIGEKGKVIGISKACRGQQRRRLMDLGIVPGTVVSAEMVSSGGDPVAYLIRGATIALRKSQSEKIYIEERLSEVSN
ncbi:MAG: DtxR family transcriptional regulator [Melioribacteraceae bacterium]|nr:DtxR family transcriptional regulator [Melioribacteraceae bacterium]MCF8353514.1 DtxR family transcriptional regulator [Melioribacteraceae bacterium]MCF8392643.1 DtxR family transcriptional regulator [Melioribacteraceae bacterium]MCF8418485.1 DtxR family transcriptional regulator [Melioribacteraceae bacterium]